MTGAGRSMFVFCLVGGLALVCGGTSPAAAQLRERETSASYGRLEHDLVVSIAAFGGLVLNDPLVDNATWSVGGEVRARVLDSGGLVLAVEGRPESHTRAFIGLDLRPLFLIRFFTLSESEQRWLDLLVDSIGLDVGVALLPFDSRIGAAFSVGLGVDVPLVFFDDSSSDLFVRIGARATFGAAQAIVGPSIGTESIADFNVHAGLGLRFLTETGLPNWEPDRYRVSNP